MPYLSNTAYRVTLRLGKAHHGYKLRPGLVIAIEPWFLKTTDEIYQDPKDGWTLKSEDAPVAAHSEHTIAITENVR